MFEYECLGCKKKYYSSIEYSLMYNENRRCKVCGDSIFYSIESLKPYFKKIKWLKREYKSLEDYINYGSENHEKKEM